MQQDLNQRLKAIEQNVQDSDIFAAASQQAEYDTRDEFCKNGEEIWIEETIKIDGERSIEAEDYFVERVEKMCEGK